MFNNLTIKTRLLLIIAFSAVLIITLAALGLIGMQKTNAGLRSVYEDRTIPLAQLAKIQMLQLDDIRTVATNSLGSLTDTSPIEANRTEISRLWDAYMATYLTPEEEQLAKQFVADRAQFVSKGLKPAMELLSKASQEEQLKHIKDVLEPNFAPLDKDIELLIQLQQDVAKQEYHVAQSRYKTLLTIAVAVGVLGLALLAFFAVTLIRGISGSLQAVQQVAAAIATGNLESRIDTHQQNEIGALLRSMKTMQDAINNFVSAQSLMAHKHAEGWIFEKIDVNQFPGTYGKMAKEINELVASHVAVKMQVVEVVGSYANGDFSRDMDRLPGDKAKVTTAVDAVKTALLAISNEIKTLVEAGVQGDFSQRVDTNSFKFIFNNLIDTCDTGFGDVERVAKALAQGDLTQTISRDYPGTFGQVKEAVNGTVANLRNMIVDIQEASDFISTASKEIAAGNNDLSHRTEEQAASLEQTAASMEELTSTVQHNAENAKQANQFAEGASQIASKGVAVVKEVINTMTDINTSSHRIGDIISVIDDIAFQTNILALNAAVEAARAGEQGKGFAVVAIEVRNLAQRAAGAAGEIKRLIDDSVEKVSGGSKLVAAAGNTMEEIVTAIQKVTSTVAEITAASFEQSSGISQVNQAIGQMDDVTQQNAALVEQAAAAAESLEEQTQNLTATVGQFKVDGRSGGRSIGQPSTVNNTVAFTRKITTPVNEQTYQAQAASVTMPTINFDEVLEKHSDWKVKLRTAITQQEKLDAATLAKDNCCDFGKWLYGDAKTHLGHRASFTDCVAKHAVFHVEAGKIATNINAKKFQEADRMLGAESAFNKASIATGIAVIRLKKDVNTPAKSQVPVQSLKAFDREEWEEF
jgi:methyl-accepting chemotaxis protein